MKIVALLYGYFEGFLYTMLYTNSRDIGNWFLKSMSEYIHDISAIEKYHYYLKSRIGLSDRKSVTLFFLHLAFFNTSLFFLGHFIS